MHFCLQLVIHDMPLHLCADESECSFGHGNFIDFALCYATSTPWYLKMPRRAMPYFGYYPHLKTTGDEDEEIAVATNN